MKTLFKVLGTALFFGAMASETDSLPISVALFAVMIIGLAMMLFSMKGEISEKDLDDNYDSDSRPFFLH